MIFILLHTRALITTSAYWFSAACDVSPQQFSPFLSLVLCTRSSCMFLDSVIASSIPPLQLRLGLLSFSGGTHVSSFFGHLISAIRLTRPNRINCPFSISSVTSSIMSILRRHNLPYCGVPKPFKPWFTAHHRKQSISVASIFVSNPFGTLSLIRLIEGYDINIIISKGMLDMILILIQLVYSY